MKIFPRQIATLLLTGSMLASLLYPISFIWADDMPPAADAPEAAADPEIETSAATPDQTESDAETDSGNPEVSEPEPTQSSPETAAAEETADSEPETSHDPAANEPGSVSASTTDETISDATSTESSTATSSANQTTASTSSSTASSTATSTDSSDTDTDAPSATGTPQIVSGQAIALANILNIVNTNFINSSGVVLFSNFFDYVREHIDLRNLFGSTGECGPLPCTDGDHVQINATSTAHIDNSITIHATSGANHIDGADEAKIDTGDAYAGLNLVNLANNNFVDSNYLLVSFNAFQGIGGDIVFPSLSNFFSSLAGAATPNLSLNNQAEINNSVHTNADSGNNSITSSTSSTITTGDSQTSANVFNQLNATNHSGSNVSILFRIHGDWAGEIFGAPDSLSWLETDDGSIYLFDTGNQTGSSSSTGSTEVTGESTAVINNDVSVIALTGDNHISNANTALISTGNAYAGANLINVANSNIVGQNWILAIINIFGNFQGNIAFGRPDLWIGEQVNAPSKIKNGSELTYTFTVINNGDSEATDAVVIDTYDADHIEIIDSSLDYSSSDGQLQWQIGTLPPGGATEISYRARIVNADDGTDITNTVTVAGRETDNNDNDNTDTVTITTDRKKTGRKIRPAAAEVLGASTALERLEVSRPTRSTTLSPTESIATQQLVISNPTNRSFAGVVIYDRLYDPSGTLIKTEQWDLGTILPHEEITLDYQIQFSAKASWGIYKLSTVVTAAGASEQVRDGNGYILLEFAIPMEAAPATLTTTEIATTSEPVIIRATSTASTTAAASVWPIALAASDVPNNRPTTASLIFFAITMTLLFAAQRIIRQMV